MLKVQDVIKQFVQKPASHNGNIELMNVAFEADQAAIFGPPTEHFKQKFYMNDGWFDPKDLACHWYDKEQAAKDRSYAWRIFAEECGSQFMTAVGKLREDNNSHHAVMYYNILPTEPATENSCCTSATIICNSNKTIDYYASYRSNDAWRAWANDYAWHSFVHNLVISRFDRSYTRGKIYWHAINLYVLKEDVEKAFRPMMSQGWRGMLEEKNT